MYKPWKTIDIKFIKMGILPQNRSVRACRVFCTRNGIDFPGKKVIDENNKLIERLDERYSPQSKGIEMKKENKTITASIKDAKPEKPKQGKERSYSFRTISADKILNGNNIRAVNDISDLVASIEALGIINPITVTPQPGMPSVFHIVAGFRRFAAAQKLGIEKIPCHVIEGNDETPEIALSENVNRINMTPYEECKAVKNLVNKKNTVQQIARKFGRTLRWVLVRKKLADAGDKVLNKVKEGTIELAAAARLADLPDDVFKKEMTSCYRTDKYFVDGVLERYHKDLSRAPFAHEECLKCAKCSACQKDLFEDEPKAYCLDPNCWAKKTRAAANGKVKELQAEGMNARIGKMENGHITYDDEAYNYRIESWQKKELEKAKESGINQRAIVDSKTAKVLKYYDKRDLPDYHEETEEERKAEEEKERKDFQFRSTKEDMTKSRIRKAIKAKIEKDGDKDDIIALLLFCVYDLDDTIHESQFDVLGIKKNIDECIGFSDIDDQVRPCDIHDAILGSVEHILKRMYEIGTLRKMYSIITYGNPKDAEPVDDEVEDEIKRIHEKKNEENNQSSNEDSENKEDDDE